MGDKIKVVLNIEDEDVFKRKLKEALAELIIDKINALPSNQRMLVYNGLLEKLKE